MENKKHLLYIDVIDINPDSIALLQQILKSIPIPKNVRLNFINKDTLLQRFPKRYDIVVGNPPYMKVKDKNLLTDTKVSRFVDQINQWFPNVDIPAAADAINLYKNGYLGDHPYLEWNREEFINKRPSTKQTEDGFDQLTSLCFTLAGAFTPSRLELKEDK